jgi:hypothetical protein
MKYPEITVPLVGEDGNAFSILGRVSRIMRQNGLKDEWTVFHSEATSGDYDNLLRTVMAWFSTETDTEADEEEWYENHPDGCYDCKEIYAVGGCPSCGDEGGY